MSVPDFALHWAEELGATARSLVQLRGGINNRVYRCDTQAGQFVIKGYAPFAADQRDRMHAEVEFLRYAAQVTPGYVPQLLHADLNRRCLVLEHIEGDPFPDGIEPPAKDIDAAVDFFLGLNANFDAAKATALPDAAEGFLRLTEHLTNVSERIAHMQTRHLPEAARPGAEALLGSLRSQLETVAEKTNERIQAGEICDAIKPDERCISPSDFGFHNAIRTPTGVKFIDFEFAGWDDPAKTAADFVLQPRIPINLADSCLPGPSWAQRQPASTKRFLALGSVLRLKWVCIMLAVLNPERLTQILATHPNTRPGNLILQRLESATRYLQQESPFGLS